MIKAFLVAVAAMALTAPASFAQGRPEGVHPSYVSIQMSNDPIDGPSIRSTICGGVVVDEERKLIATAWHCVPNQLALISKPGVFTVNGSNTKFVAMAAEADMALFQVEDLNGLKAANFATPERGDVIRASAFYEEFTVVAPLSDRYTPQVTVKVTLDWEGKVNAVAIASRRGGERGDQITVTPFKWVVVNGNPAPGFSGGPAFDRSGNFVGIVSNGNGGFTNVSSSENVTVLMQHIK